MRPLIAVVDDDADIRDLMAALLEDAGYLPVLLGTGDAVLETLKRVRPVAIILDPNLSPGMRHSDLLAQLAQEASLAATPTLVYSTDAKHLTEQAPQCHARGYGLLTKPFAIRDLSQWLHERVGPVAAVPV